MHPSASFARYPEATALRLDNLSKERSAYQSARLTEGLLLTPEARVMHQRMLLSQLALGLPEVIGSYNHPMLGAPRQIAEATRSVSIHTQPIVKAPSLVEPPPSGDPPATIQGTSVRPKRSLTAYTIFFKEQRTILVNRYGPEEP
jgi:hypothetical protein